ncbi:hypothetical protein R1sor_011233 [Riccia sorocarpa]|uniref:CCHC-type domain-containing protein n=1 Tax=Riccia sorocarpa TaxID=122646 RepID=A0ABD3I0A7_9MARC
MEIDNCEVGNRNLKGYVGQSSVGQRDGRSSGGLADPTVKMSGGPPVAGPPNVTTTSHPPGFQAWMSFRAKDRGVDTAGRRRQDETSKSQAAMQGVQTGETVGCSKDWGKEVTWDMMAAELAHLPIFEEVATGEDVDVRVVEVDIVKAAKKLDKELAMDRPPQFLDGKLVRFIEWEQRGEAKLLPHLKPAWIELRDIPSFLEDQTDVMIKALGPVVYHSFDKQSEMRYADVRGCILVDMSQELPAKIGLKTPWGKTYLQSVTYTKLPDRCFICLKQGHIARSCPSKRVQETNRELERMEVRGEIQTEEVKETESKSHGKEKQEHKAEGFIPSKSRSRRKGSLRGGSGEGTSTAYSNRFNALQADEEGEDNVERGQSLAADEGQGLAAQVLIAEDQTVGMEVEEAEVYLPKEAHLGAADPAVQDNIVVTSWGVGTQVILSSGCWGDETEKEDLDEGATEAEQSHTADVKEETREVQLSTAIEDEHTELNRDIIRRSQKEILTEAVHLLRAGQEEEKTGGEAMITELQITEENPFKSYCSLLVSHPNKVDIGREVNYAGSPLSTSWMVRAPKKKGKKPEAQCSSQAGKRRVLGALDPNGYRLMEKQNSGSSTEDERRRDRKMQDGGLNQVREVISNMAESSKKRKGKGNENKCN